MISAIFDSLGYFEKLKAAGVPEEQRLAGGLISPHTCL